MGDRARSCPHSPARFSSCSALSAFLRLLRRLCVNKLFVSFSFTPERSSLRAGSPIYASEASRTRTRERAVKPQGPPRGRISSRASTFHQRAAVWTAVSAVISQDYAQLYNFSRPGALHSDVGAKAVIFVI